MSDRFAPTASWPVLHQRAELLDRLRSFFRQRSFLEVETPLLSADTVVDRHLEPIPVRLSPVAGANEGDRRWLQTSPELAMKRLLASGAEALFQITHAFRGGERGRLHNPEFTLAEWYRVGDDMQQGIELLSELAAEMLGRGAAKSISYREAFIDIMGIDPLLCDTSELCRAARQSVPDVPRDWPIADRDLWLDLLLSHCVQPYLGTTSPAILYDYPASQAALAVVRNDQPPVAERFELFVEGVELANGYHELLDSAVLRRRNAEVNRLRQNDGKESLPEDSRLLEAMDHGLPACAGVALGFDRLVMIAVGASCIDEVLTFPIERA